MPPSTADEQIEVQIRSTLDTLSDALAKGRSAELIAYLNAMAHFHNYSYRNAVLICSQRPDATKVAGKQTWKRLGRQPKPQTEGIRIQVPILPQWAYRLPPAKRFWMPCAGFVEGNVYDVSDTVGDPLPDIPSISGNPGPYLARLKCAIAARKIRLEYVDSLDGPLGISKGGLIQLLDSFTAAREFAVMLHEFAHELLHHRKKQFPQLLKVIETEAEAIAYVVAVITGIDMGTFSSDYIKLYNGDANVLSASLRRIHKTAKLILKALRFETNAAGQYA